MSEIKVNKISPRTACGTTTLGDSGDTFTIPAGVSITNSGTASGFGATGAASWNTTVKTGDFTAVAGEGYFVNTTSGAVNVTLPAGTAGAVVAIKDYAGTFDTNNVTLTRNGSDKIGGAAVNGTLSTEGQAVTLVFIDSTQGWLVTDSGLQSDAPTSQYVTATGGTPTTSPCGDYKIHTFTGPGTFAVSCAGNPSGSTTVEYLVVAGGAGGSAACIGGGGGAGGFRFAAPTLSPLTYPAKPLAGPAAITATVASFPIVVGAGGAGAINSSNGNASPNGGNGSVSSFSTITSTGGGGGGGQTNAPGDGQPGGSGGGSMYTGNAGSGNTPPVSPPQGNNGGGNPGGSPAPAYGGAAGGGALAVGGNGSGSAGGNGGVGGGLPNAFGTSGQNCGANYYFSGGGGGATEANPVPQGGLGGGANGGYGGGSAPSANRTGQNATANTGGGGGGTCAGGPGPFVGGAGGSGIVIIRYKFQN